MLDLTRRAQVTVTPVDKLPDGLVSVVGHQDLANILGVEYNRASLRLEEGDELYVAQVTGGRLPEGTTTLPDGVEIRFFHVRVVYES